MKVLINRLALVVSILVIFGFKSGGDDPISDIVKKLIDFYRKFPQEKIYVHTDKPYYLAGESIWFRAYLVNATGHQKSNLSNKLFVYLISDKDSVIKRMVLNAAGGSLSGSIIIPDSVAEGNYTIAAFTSRMLNFDQRFLFTKDLYIGSRKNQFYLQAEINQSKEPNKPSTVVVSISDFSKKPLVGESGDLDIISAGKLSKNSSFITNENGKGVITLANIRPEEWNNLKFIVHYKSINKVILPAQVSDSFDLRFLPEGGNMINGSESVVAFIGVSHDGLPISVEGYVKNDKGNRITTFQTFHDGMGKFSFIPSSGRSYYAVVILKSGKELTYPLPTIDNYAYQLSIVYQDEKKLKVKIAQGDSLYKKGKASFLLGTSHGKVCFASNGHDMYEVEIPKDSFPDGVAKLTLFTADGLPVSERMVFIKHQRAVVSIETDKGQYGPREEVKMTVKSMDTQGNVLPGDYSLSVTDDHAVPIQPYGENIYTHLLLSEDLNGYINQPGFYFDPKQPKADDALDMIMLTHGWSRFSWSEITRKDMPALGYGADSALSLTGIIVTPAGQPAKGYITSLYAGRWGSNFISADYEKGIAVDTTDEQGKFSFHNLVFTDSTQFFVQVKNQKGIQKDLKIRLDDPHWPIITLKAEPGVNLFGATADEISHYKILDQKVNPMMGKNVELSPVNVKAYKKVPHYGDKRRISQFSTIITTEEIERAGNPNLADALFLVPGVSNKDGHITIQGGATFSGTSTVINEPLLIMDGVALEGSDVRAALNNIPYDAVDFIEVLKGTDGAAYGVRGGNGVILVNTKQTNDRASSYVVKGRNIFYVPGYHVAREFYVPKYDVPEIFKSTTPDNRTTIYWKGNIHIDSTGKVNLKFFTADPATSYSVILEGLAENGDIIHQTVQILRQ